MSDNDNISSNPDGGSHSREAEVEELKRQIHALKKENEDKTKMYMKHLQNIEEQRKSYNFFDPLEPTDLYIQRLRPRNSTITSTQSLPQSMASISTSTSNQSVGSYSFPNPLNLTSTIAKPKNYDSSTSASKVNTISKVLIHPSSVPDLIDFDSEETSEQEQNNSNLAQTQFLDPNCLISFSQGLPASQPSSVPVCSQISAPSLSRDTFFFEGRSRSAPIVSGITEKQVANTIHPTQLTDINPAKTQLMNSFEYTRPLLSQQFLQQTQSLNSGVHFSLNYPRSLLASQSSSTHRHLQTSVPLTATQPKFFNQPTTQTLFTSSQPLNLCTQKLTQESVKNKNNKKNSDQEPANRKKILNKEKKNDRVNSDTESEKGSVHSRGRSSGRSRQFYRGRGGHDNYNQRKKQIL